MATLSGLQSGFFTDIDVVDSIAINGDVGTANQVLTSDGTNTSYQDPTLPAVSSLLNAGTGITITSTGNPETIATNVKQLVLDGSAVSSAPQTFNPNANGGSQTITINDTDNQLTLVEQNGIVITDLGGFNRGIATDIDADTIVFNGTEMEVAKVPNALTAGTNISFNTGTTYDGSAAITISATDTDTQLNLTEGNGITITNTGGVNRTIAVNADGTTLSNNVGSGQAGVLKVPNALTAGTNISFNTGTTYDGSGAITISSTDTNTTYNGGKNITIDTTPNPDEIDLDDDLTGIDSITFTSTAGSTALTGNNYPSNPTTATNLDLSSATNVFPNFVGGSEILKSISYIDNTSQNFNRIYNTSFEFFFNGSQDSGTDTLEIDFTATSTTGYCEFGFYANTLTGGMIFMAGIAAATGGTSPFSTSLGSGAVSIDAYKLGLFDGDTTRYSLKEILDFTSFENTYITSKYFFNNLTVGTRYRMALYGRCHNSGSIYINAGGRGTSGTTNRSFHQPAFMKFYEYDSSIGGARTTGSGGGGGGDDY